MGASTGILHLKKNDAWRLDHAKHRESVRFLPMGVVPTNVLSIRGTSNSDLRRGAG